jgi:ParB family chromosome partitioning protein
VAEIRTVKLSRISFSPGLREDIGDINALADSIQAVGLLQPLVVTPDLHLVAGRRRLQALYQLGRNTADVYVVDNLTDALSQLRAQRDENTCRKEFTPSEAVKIGKALEALERREAKKRQKAGGRAGGKASGKLPEASGGDTRDKVAGVVGLSGRTYEKAKAVVEAAEADPALTPVVEEMDRTGKVDPAFQKVKGRQESAGAANTESPPGSMPGPGAADAAAPPEWAKNWPKLKEPAWRLGQLATYARRMVRTRAAERHVEDVEYLLVRLQKAVRFIEVEVLGKHEAEQANGETPAAL